MAATAQPPLHPCFHTNNACHSTATAPLPTSGQGQIRPLIEGSSVQAAQYHYSYGIIMLQLTLHTPGKGFQNLTTIYTTLSLHMFFGREKTTTIILY